VPTDSQVISAVLGPLGALVLAVIVLAGLTRAFVVLWREHLKADKDDRDQRDKALAIAHDQVAATNAVSDDVAALSGAVRDLATAVAQTAKQVGGTAAEVKAIRRDMEARRRNDA
jgi:hypothetical protein